MTGRSRRGSTGPDALSLCRVVFVLACVLLVAGIATPPAGALSCAQPPLRFGGREYLPIAFREPLRLGGPLGGAVLPDFRDSEDSCETEDERVVALEIAGVPPRYAVALYGQPRVVWVSTNRCRAERRAEEFVECFRRPLRYGGREYLPVVGRAELRRPLAVARPRTEDARVFAVERVSPVMAVAVEDRPRLLYVASGMCTQTEGAELLPCLRAGFAVTFTPESTRPGDTVRVRVDGSFRRAIGQSLSLVGAGRTVALGRLGRDRTFEVPDVEAGNYRVVTSGIAVGRLRVDEPAYSRTALVALIATVALAAAAFGALQLRQR